MLLFLFKTVYVQCILVVLFNFCGTSLSVISKVHLLQSTI